MNITGTDKMRINFVSLTTRSWNYLGWSSLSSNDKETWSIQSTLRGSEEGISGRGSGFRPWCRLSCRRPRSNTNRTEIKKSGHGGMKSQFWSARHIAGWLKKKTGRKIESILVTQRTKYRKIFQSGFLGVPFMHSLCRYFCRAFSKISQG